MDRAAVVSKHEDRDLPTSVAHDAVVSVPSETLARLARLATASMLSTGLAHEFANPLSCLTAAVNALDARVGQLRSGGAASPAELAEMASDIELASVSVEELVILVHDFQRFLRPGSPATAVPIELKPAILRALRMARARLSSTTPVSVALSDAPLVRVPPGRITQVILNLLFNAAEAVADRPWSANLVEVRLDSIGGWAVIDVKDNGPGLSAETRKRLFEPGLSTKTGSTSLGLGLAICRELVRASGGEISVSTPLSPGTVFRVVLPPAGLDGPLP